MNAMMEQPQTKTVSLFYREGSSDKEYHVSLEPKGEGFVVNFAYGACAMVAKGRAIRGYHAGS